MERTHFGWLPCVPNSTGQRTIGDFGIESVEIIYFTTFAIQVIDANFTKVTSHKYIKVMLVRNTPISRANKEGLCATRLARTTF